MTVITPCLPYLRLQLALEHFDALPSDITPQQTERLERLVHQGAMLQQALLSHARAPALAPDEAAVTTAVATLRARFADESAYTTTLRRNQLTPELLNHALRIELWGNAVADALCADVREIAPLDAELYYQLHRSKFSRPERRLTRHVLITINDDVPGSSRDEALGRIRRIRADLLREPHKFARMAARYSECPTALKEGVLGWCKQGQLYPELDEVLFTLPPGGLSLPLESPIGFHLVRCDEIAPARVLSFDEALPLIKASHLQQARKRRLQGLLQPATPQSIAL